MTTRRHHSGERGFTLMETLVTIVLVAIVTLGVFRIFNSTNQSFHRGTQNIDGQQNSRAALSWLTKELRGAKGFTRAASDEVTFLSDANVPNQIRTFRLDRDDQDGDGDTSELLLIRNPADDGTPGVFTDEIAVGLDSLSFIYRNSAGNVTTSRAAVQEVEVFVFATGNQMRDEDADESAQTRQSAMSSRVRCRNLGKSVPTLGDVTPPAAPTGLSVTAGCGTATIFWDANSEPDIAGYYLSYDKGSGGTPYGGIDAHQGPSPIFVGNVTTYTLTGLDQSGNYYFNLQAVDVADNSSMFTNEVQATPTDSAPPSTPTNLTGRVIGNDQIQLSWDRSPEWDVGWYTIRWLDVRVDSTTAVSLILESLDEQETYVCMVSASDNCGNASVISSPITITMVPCDQDVDFPDIPASLAVTPGDEFVRLAWARVADDDVVGYQVYFVESGESVGYTLLVGNVDTYSVYGLENGTEYDFQVAALDGCGHVGGFTGRLSATPVQCAANTSPPATLHNLVAVDLGLGDQVSLSWTASTDSDVLGYFVYWGTTDGIWDYSVDVGESIFHTIAGLVAGTEYYFTVTAYDVCGNESLPASSARATPTWGCICPPDVRTGSPDPYDVVMGTVDWFVDAEACSTTSVARVEFEIDGTVRYVDYDDPWEYGDFGGGWTTSLEANGPHSLVARAVDENGCLASDTTTVYVDNTGVGVSCVGVSDPEAAIEGAYDNEIVVRMANFSAVDTYELDRIVLDWDAAGAYPTQVLLDDQLAWYSGDWPDAAPGDTLALWTAFSFPPEYEFDMRIVFWDYPASGNPDLPLAEATYTATFLGGPIVECGPYEFAVAVDCFPDVSIASVNSPNPYDVAGVPVVGAKYYTDRNYTLTYLPAELEQSILVRTPNNDKNKGGSLQLKLEFPEDVTVYLAYDPRGTPPNWIRNDFDAAGLSIGVTDTGTSTLGLWRRNLDAGTHTFYGNKAVGWGGAVGTNYVIFVVCREPEVIVP